MLTGNKGEWSEFYAFLKILADGKLFAADKDLQKIADEYSEIQRVLREESESGKKVYSLVDDPVDIMIFNENDELIGSVKKSDISSKVKNVFDKIKSSGKNTFTIPVADELMNQLQCKQIKAGSARKSDLFLVLFNRVFPASLELGFSIKSRLGAASTLLNPSRATNFVFKVVDSKVDASAINSIEGKSKIRDRIQAIYDSGANLEYEKMDNENFEDNLRMNDVMFPQMLAELVKAFYSGNGNTLSEITDFLDKEGIFNEKFRISSSTYEHKIKRFLIDIALGMVPTKPWDGYTKAHGGYLIVREDGEIVCYHLYVRDEFEDYLFHTTRLDSPSTSRYEYASVYEENGEQFIKLNLQIRFIK